MRQVWPGGRPAARCSGGPFACQGNRRRTGNRPASLPPGPPQRKSGADCFPTNGRQRQQGKHGDGQQRAIRTGSTVQWAGCWAGCPSAALWRGGRAVCRRAVDVGCPLGMPLERKFLPLAGGDRPRAATIYAAKRQGDGAEEVAGGFMVLAGGESYSFAQSPRGLKAGKILTNDILETRNRAIVPRFDGKNHHNREKCLTESAKNGYSSLRTCCGNRTVTETGVCPLIHLACVAAPPLQTPRSRNSTSEGAYVPRSILEAIKMGLWDFEPPDVEFSKFRRRMRCQGPRKSSRCWPSGSVAACPCGTRPIGTTWKPLHWCGSRGNRGSQGTAGLSRRRDSPNRSPCAGVSGVVLGHVRLTEIGQHVTLFAAGRHCCLPLTGRQECLPS